MIVNFNTNHWEVYMSINTNFNQPNSTLVTVKRSSSTTPLIATSNQNNDKNIKNFAMQQQKDTVSISSEARNRLLTARASVRPNSWVDTALDWAKSTVSWLKKAGQFAVDAAKEGINFLVLDDVRTIFNPNAGITEKGVALVSLFPAGKVVKSGKLFELLRKAGKSADVDAFAGLGKIQKFNAKGILLDGDSRTGWEHIYNRHVAGTTANRGTTLFPRALGDAQIKNLIMESLEKGTLESTHLDGTKIYTYRPRKYGISEMTTIVTKDNIIRTSYPNSGTSVIRK